MNNSAFVRKFQVLIEQRGYTLKDTHRVFEKFILNFTYDPTRGRKYTISSLQPYALTKVSIREGAGEKPIWGSYSEPKEFDMPEGSTFSVFNVL